LCPSDEGQEKEEDGRDQQDIDDIQPAKALEQEE
jgi:hypothetical protein